MRNVVRSLKRVTELGKELQRTFPPPCAHVQRALIELTWTWRAAAYLVPLNSSADGPDTSSTRSVDPPRKGPLACELTRADMSRTIHTRLV